MNWLVQGIRSSVGAKFLMALTGLLLFGFTIAHMLGNLQVFAGPERLNAYAKSLQDLGPILWLMRIGLLTIVIVHIACAFTLTRRNQRARPVAYAMKKPLRSTYASRTMLFSGLIILAFVIYHLLHFTWGVTHPEHFKVQDASGRHDVYRMVVLGFRQPLVTIVYCIAMGLLGMHLAHGAASFFQSMGWNKPKYKNAFAALGRSLAALVVLGNLAMPLCVYFKIIGGEVAS